MEGHLASININLPFNLFLTTSWPAWYRLEPAASLPSCRQVSSESLWYPFSEITCFPFSHETRSVLRLFWRDMKVGFFKLSTNVHNVKQRPEKAPSRVCCLLTALITSIVLRSKTPFLSSDSLQPSRQHLNTRKGLGEGRGDTVALLTPAPRPCTSPSSVNSAPWTREHLLLLGSKPAVILHKGLRLRRRAAAGRHHPRRAWEPHFHFKCRSEFHDVCQFRFWKCCFVSPAALDCRSRRKLEVVALIFSKAVWQFLHTTDLGLRHHALLLCPRLTRQVLLQLPSSRPNVPGREY